MAGTCRWAVSTGRVFGAIWKVSLIGLKASICCLLQNSGVETFDVRATVDGPHSVRLADGRVVTAKVILLATGGWPSVPDVPGAEYAITSNEIFHLEALPQRILIVGGGYIACEFAGILNGLGVQTHLWYRGEAVLRGFDKEARDVIVQGMQERGVQMHMQTNVARIEKQGAGYCVTDTKGARHDFDVVMYATGRTPKSAGLGLEALGIGLDSVGAVQVDGFSQTSVPSIYAIGDVTNRVNLTPVAIREGMAFVETALKGNPTSVDHELIPTAVFTQPEFGTIGLSEEQARAQEPIEVYATAFRPMNISFIDAPNKVLMKLVVSQKTRKILGCHIVADGAGEMIQLAGIAVKMGATKEDFDRVCAVHPTVSEELVTMKTPVRSA